MEPSSWWKRLGGWNCHQGDEVGKRGLKKASKVMGKLFGGKIQKIG